MRIINGHDYYDYVAYLGGYDESAVWTRTKGERPPLWNEWDTLFPAKNMILAKDPFLGSTNLGGSMCAVVLNGKVYPFLMYRNDPKVPDPVHYVWSPDDPHVDISASRWWDDGTPEDYFATRPASNAVVNFMRERRYVNMVVRGMFVTFFDNILEATVHTTFAHDVSYLGAIGFSRVLDAQQAYAEHEMWFGSLNNIEKPMVEIDEKSRFIERGFDSKTSFRGKNR